MEKLMRCFMSVLLLSAMLSSGLAEEFFGEGGTLELRPNFSGDINTVTWKRNNYLMVAEWVEGINDLSYYNVFKGRTNLDKETGTLEITKLSPADRGEYSVEINNMVLPERYNVKVIKKVPQPVVDLNLLSCSDAWESCSLYCEGNTEGAEPVTYSWKMGDREWMKGEKSRNITNNKETQRLETLSCRMKNPISEKQSDPIPNPFYRADPADSELWIKLLGPVLRSLIILSLSGIVVFFMWQKRESVRKLICPCLTRKDDDDVYEIVA